MNPLAKDPPCRLGPPDDWESLVAVVASYLCDEHMARRPLAGRTKQGAAIIAEFAVVLDKAMAGAEFAPERDDGAMPTPAEVKRLLIRQPFSETILTEVLASILRHPEFDRRSPAAAESVMLVARRAVESDLAAWAGTMRDMGHNPATGEPWTWQECLDEAVSLAVLLARACYGASTPATIRAEVWADFRLAMGDAGPDGDGVQGVGILRMCFVDLDFDWYDPTNRANAEDRIRAILDAELP